MNKRRLTASKRCPKCRINFNLCFCNVIKPIETKTRVSIIMHFRETHLTSNTATLTKLVLPKCNIFKRGVLDNPFDIKNLEITEDEMPLYLFPHEGAEELNEEFLEKYKDKNFHLIVPDGSWSQAIKFYRREKGLDQIKCVSIPSGDPGRYKLRKSNNENRLSTYEAITRALAVLEQNESLQKEMEYIFDTMVERVLSSRTSFEN